MYVEQESTAERPLAHAALESERFVRDTTRTHQRESPADCQRSTAPTESHRPTYFRVNEQHVAIDTLLYYDVPYEVDSFDPDYINILRDMSTAETEMLFEHTRRSRSRLPTVLEHRALRPSKSDTTGSATADTPAKFDVMKYIQKTREARKALQSVSLDHSTASGPVDKHKLPSQPHFERSTSPPSAPTPVFRTRSSALSLGDKRREYESKPLAKATTKATEQLVVDDHHKKSLQQAIPGNSERQAAESDSKPALVGTTALLRQPKSVQSLFVRTLFTMLENESIQHLIQWSSTNNGIIFSPSSEFAKVLLSYFRHTSISSFISQLNIYGFQKVRNVLHNDSPDCPMLEFKLFDGTFHRGDSLGLQEMQSRPNRGAPMDVDSKHIRSYGTEKADLETYDPPVASDFYEPKEPSCASIGPPRDVRLESRQEAVLPEEHALPELDDLIAGWQTSLPLNQAERDSGFHDGDIVDALNLRTPDLVTHKLEDRPTLEDDDPLLGPGRASEVHIIRSSQTSPINDPRLLATVENAIKRLILPELVALKGDQSSQKDQSGTDQLGQLTLPSRQLTMRSLHSAAEQDQTCQTTGSPTLWRHGNDQSSWSASVPDQIDEQHGSSSLRQENSSDGRISGMVATGDSHDPSFRFDHIFRAPSPSNTDDTRESLLSSHGGSECASETSPPYCDFDIHNALDSAMSVVKSLMLQKLISHAISENMDETGSPDTSSRGSRVANATFPLQSSGSTTKNNGGKRARGGGHDPNDDGGDDSDGDDSNRPKKKGPSHRIPQRRLKCPFYQRQPEKYTKAACRGEGFAEMGKLKDHLKRVHMHPSRCLRCHVEIPEKELDAHVYMENRCAKSPAPLDDRISPQTLSNLDFKRAPFVNAKSTEEKWKMLYKLLFPADSEAQIPSPYDRNTISPDLARALAEALEEELNEELALFMEPIVTRMKTRIPAIIERCRTNLTARSDDTNEGVKINSPLPEPVRSPCTAGEPRKLRKKSNFSAQSLNRSPQVFLQPVVTVGEVKKKQPQYSPVPQMTPSGSSEGSEETPAASASASTDNIAQIEDASNRQFCEPSANIVGVGDWNMYDSNPIPLHPGFEANVLDFDLQSPGQGVEDDIPALRPYQNDPYLYGGAAFGADDMQEWSNMTTLGQKSLDEYPPARQQLFDEEGLSFQVTDWQVIERGQSTRRGPG